MDSWKKRTEKKAFKETSFCPRSRDRVVFFLWRYFDFRRPIKRQKIMVRKTGWRWFNILLRNQQWTWKSERFPTKLENAEVKKNNKKNHLFWFLYSMLILDVVVVVCVSHHYFFLEPRKICLLRVTHSCPLLVGNTTNLITQNCNNKAIRASKLEIAERR